MFVILKEFCELVWFSLDVCWESGLVMVIMFIFGEKVKGKQPKKRIPKLNWLSLIIIFLLGNIILTVDKIICKISDFVEWSSLQYFRSSNRRDIFKRVEKKIKGIWNITVIDKMFSRLYFPFFPSPKTSLPERRKII